MHVAHTDHLGKTRLVADNEKRPVWQWPYSAFGNNKPTGPLVQRVANDTPHLRRTEPIEFGLRFPGQQEDAEAGLSNNLFRWYQSGNGRYTQPDPIGLPGGLNRFGYVENDPLNWVDPLGLRGNAAGGSRLAPSTTMYRQMLLPGMPGAGPGPQRAATLSPSLLSPYLGRQDGMRLIADSIGNLDFRTPSNVNWGNPVPSPAVPPGCTVISAPQSANMCSANSTPIVVCGPVIGPLR